MQSICWLQPRRLEVLRPATYVIVYKNISDGTGRPWFYPAGSIREPALLYLKIKNGRPDVLDFAFAHLLLNTQLCNCLKKNLNLRLFIERAIIAAVVEIDSHFLLLDIAIIPNSTCAVLRTLTDVATRPWRTPLSRAAGPGPSCAREYGKDQVVMRSPARR